jgi:vacuolar-type H+-ATPase subunit H
MDTTEVLGHLLKIESNAAALVDEAQEEADRRIAEAEKQNRAAYEERFREENERLEREFLKSKEMTRQRYREELEAYKHKISSVTVNNEIFSSLLDQFLAGGL